MILPFKLVFFDSYKFWTCLDIQYFACFALLSHLAELESYPPDSFFQLPSYNNNSNLNLLLNKS